MLTGEFRGAMLILHYQAAGMTLIFSLHVTVGEPNAIFWLCSGNGWCICYCIHVKVGSSPVINRALSSMGDSYMHLYLHSDGAGALQVMILWDYCVCICDTPAEQRLKVWHLSWRYKANIYRAESCVTRFLVWTSSKQTPLFKVRHGDLLKVSDDKDTV